MAPRLCSKTTDKLMIVGELLRVLNLKKALVTWDRIEDPQEGAVIVPVLELEFADAPCLPPQSP